MKVHELIELLGKFPPDMRVIVNGYEGGFHDISNPGEHGIKLNQNTAWYYGPHDNPSRDEQPDEIALLIG